MSAVEKLRFCWKLLISPIRAQVIFFLGLLCLLLQTEVGPKAKMQNIQSVNQDDPPAPTWIFTDSLQGPEPSKTLYPGFQCNLNDLS